MSSASLQRLREDHIHNGFCEALIDDFRATIRYVALEEPNRKTYSIEFVRLLIDICSELEALAKLLCERQQPGWSANVDRPNISHWGPILSKCSPSPASMEMRLDGWLDVIPWDSWNNPRSDGSLPSPDWWESYQHVKHDRLKYFSEANQENVYCALSGLAVVCYFHGFADSWLGYSRFIQRWK